MGLTLLMPSLTQAKDLPPALTPAPDANTEPVAFAPPLGSATDYLPLVRAAEESYLLLKLSERTLYLYNRDTLVNTYPVAIGREGWETPTGRFTIFQMQQNPVWEHPFTGELVPPGADNPLGRRWLGFWSDGTNAIGFHGTPDEATIGQAVSHGCVRLYNRDVIELYGQVTIGTTVYVVP
jgi:lipoprotein-anchoring transpeptidase ErfK/SrfK